MRMLPLIATASAIFFLPSAAHADGTWCARYSSQGGASNCGFYSFEQCQATVRGIGGFCERNPFTAYGSVREPRRRHHRGY
jgi:hypothetical protein